MALFSPISMHHDVGGPLKEITFKILSHYTQMSTPSSKPIVKNSSISSKTLEMMKSIISIIKDMDLSSNEEDHVRLRRLLYRTMDSLVELKLALLQLLVSTPSTSTQ